MWGYTKFKADSPPEAMPQLDAFNYNKRENSNHYMIEISQYVLLLVWPIKLVPGNRKYAFCFQL